MSCISAISAISLTFSVRIYVPPYAIVQKLQTDAEMVAAERRWVRRHILKRRSRELSMYSTLLFLFVSCNSAEGTTFPVVCLFPHV